MSCPPVCPNGTEIHTGAGLSDEWVTNVHVANLFGSLVLSQMTTVFATGHWMPHASLKRALLSNVVLFAAYVPILYGYVIATSPIEEGLITSTAGKALMLVAFALRTSVWCLYHITAGYATHREFAITAMVTFAFVWLLEPMFFTDAFATLSALILTPVYIVYFASCAG